MAGRFFQRLRTLGPAVGLYLLGVALVGFALDGGIYSVLLNLFLLRLGFGPELIGLVNSAGTLTFALASLPAGALGGRLGSRADHACRAGAHAGGLGAAAAGRRARAGGAAGVADWQ